MAKKPVKLELPAGKTTAHVLPPASIMQDAFKVGDEDLLFEKANEISRLLWIREDASQDAKHARILRALELYESLEPSDGAEGMLAMQMVGTHDAALECLRRAALSNQTFEGRDMALKHAQKLMTLYTQQLAAMNKHRGKGQQKVTVEHVNVEPGGQAIVGTVEAGQHGNRERVAAPAIEHSPEVPMPARKSKSKAHKKKLSG